MLTFMKLVDADARMADPWPDEGSLANARHLITVVASLWCFLQLKTFESPSHTSFAAIKTYGESSAAMTQFCRAVLNHAPFGVRRSFLAEATDCPSAA